MHSVLRRLTVGERGAARSIAVRHRRASTPGRPGLFWLPGYRSDMDGAKAQALDRYATARGLACTRFDYSGHGLSGGDFMRGTVSRWLEESLAVFEAFTGGPQLLVGSSMGGWIAIGMARELRRRGEKARLGGLLLIAPAADFTCDLLEPRLTPAQRRDLADKGYFEEPTPYGPEPQVYTRALIEDGRDNRVLTGTIETGCPVRVLQGMKDPDVPYAHALRLVEHLPMDDVTLTLIRDGDHRLSRQQDLELLLDAAERTVGTLSGA